ncbi:hypothetical protein GCM10020358_59580 [Amorphoplanes nipponensis]|uniref:Uncharacterized protein n=1 Tax=Actinoplanes nipponensis TaxID=135950 RepID=A0A919JD16_9ACTN|nr:hypothetical protein [Actinoplanes nipponensis]GIE46936.1 hypothetical protein Ani05nite_04700 [Actinoplanes nipponensis]
MPGDFIDEVRIFQCGTRPDGTAIMCSEVHFGVKIPFTLPGDSLNESGWQEAGKKDVHLSLASLVQVMRNHGITVNLDEKELERLREAHSQADSDDD